MQSRSLNAKPSRRSLLRALWAVTRITLRAAPGRMAALAAARVGLDLAIPLQAVAMKQAIDALARGSGDTAVAWATAGAVVLVAVDAIAWASLSFLMGVRERVGQAVDRHLIDLAMSVPGIEHYERPEYQDELQLLRNQREALSMLAESVLNNATKLIQAVGTVGLLLAVDPRLGLLPLFGLPAVVLAAQAERRTRRVEEEVVQRMRLRTVLFNVATGVQHGKELRVFGAREAFRRRHDELGREVTAELRRLELKNGAAESGGWLIFALGFVGAIALVVDLARRGQATPGDIVMTLTLATQINGQLEGAAQSVRWMMQNLKVGARYLWLSEYAAQATAAVVPALPVPPPERLVHGIDVEGVSFTYPGSEQAVLRDVSLHLPAGSTVAIVGDNGAGKSTLVKLLCRFYEPTSGRIVVDGIPMPEIDPAEWRTRLSAGFQDFAKLELLARETVGVGHLPDIDRAPAVVGALDRASASDVVTDLPEGLETQVGRQFGEGVELSGGQWQKLALGRAMMRELPLLLVLDEPTSSLDAKTEHALFERYAGAAQRVGAEVGAITVLVSHRFSTVRMADLIVVVDEGGLAEVGTHAELVARGGIYAELYEIQARAYR